MKARSTFIVRNTKERIDLESCRKFLDHLGKKIGVHCKSDWYSVKLKNVIRNGGRGVLAHFGNSLQQTLVSLWPEYPWKLWLFEKVHNGFWSQEINRREYLTWLASELRISQHDQWYKISYETIVDKNGTGFLEFYGKSLQTALIRHFPEYPWKPWLFERVPVGYWNQELHRKQFLQWLELELGIFVHDNWYNVRVEDIHSRGGSAFLDYYNGSLSIALSALYPHHNWKPWLFRQAPNGYWDDDRNVGLYLDWLEKKLFISEPRQWYEVSQDHVLHFKGRYLLKGDHGYRSFLVHLKKRYPQENWDLKNFYLPLGKTKRLLYRILQSIFEGHGIEVFFNTTFPGMHFVSSSYSMRFDLYLPRLSLAIEYHGPQHYEHKIFFGSPERQQALDIQKSDVCTRNGITMICIGYWWDFELDSLIKAFRLHRPDLFTDLVKDSIQYKSL